MRNGETHESIADAVAPASLTRAYRSTVVWKGETYMQMTSPLSNNWIKVVEPTNLNEQIYSIKVRMTKSQLTELKLTAVPITRVMLDLAKDETAQILQDKTIWRFEPNGSPFIL